MRTMTSVAAGTWAVDVARTRVAFTARHFFGRSVPGTIAVTAGTIEVGPDGRPRRLHVSLDPASIDTGHARRDADLCRPRFLAVDAYPQLEIFADRIVATASGWCADAVLRGRGREAPLRIEAAPAGDTTALRLLVTGTAQLDLHDLGLRVPGFLVRRMVEVSVAAQVSRQP
jgi:polyisoprenoid-binding protein YceI